MLSRRLFSAALLLAPQLRAQQAPKTIGVLSPLSSYEFEPSRDAFVIAMRDLGYVRGKHFVFVERFADGRPDRFPALAADLAKLNVDVIYASGELAVLAAQRAAKVPIVFESVPDPVQAGIADDLAHPGRNATGLTNIASDLNPKRVQFLKDVKPTLTRLGLLVPPLTANWGSVVFEPSMRAAAEPFGVRTLSFVAAGAQELEPTFKSMMQWGAEAVVVGGSFWFERQRIAQLALGSKLPLMCPSSGYVDAGALMSFGVDRLFEARKVASYITSIFRGANAADLPIEQPTRVDLVISRKTAKALGLEIPQRLLLQADRVID